MLSTGYVGSCLNNGVADALGACFDRVTARGFTNDASTCSGTGDTICYRGQCLQAADQAVTFIESSSGTCYAQGTGVGFSASSLLYTGMRIITCFES